MQNVSSPSYSRVDRLVKDLMKVTKIVLTISFLLTMTVMLLTPRPVNAAANDGLSSLGYYKDPYSKEERSIRLYDEGLKHKEKAQDRERRAKQALNGKTKKKLLSKAQKDYQKAIEKQRKAVKIDGENYKAFNELGYALRMTGDLRKAVGAHNYALSINPKYYPAWEYRGEILLELGFFADAKQSYMVLFQNDRKLASQLMASFDEWLAANISLSSEIKDEFVEWLDTRKRFAKISYGLSSRSETNR
jgi:tetratricopeptide (TPR) repeat protein